MFKAPSLIGQMVTTLPPSKKRLLRTTEQGYHVQGSPGGSPKDSGEITNSGKSEPPHIHRQDQTAPALLSEWRGHPFLPCLLPLWSELEVVPISAVN